ncbi:MAG: hypothetical protein HC806_00780 [Anaerolineae bacterium]|nr:hypothetical protein [Anaerolineae bacterium]
MKRALLIWNPAAGRMGAEQAVKEAARVLKQAGWRVQLEGSKSATHITELARGATQTGMDAVFIAGGMGQ